MKDQMGAQLAAVDQSFARMNPTMLKLAAQSQLTQQEQELASLTGSERASRAQQVASLNT